LICGPIAFFSSLLGWQVAEKQVGADEWRGMPMATLFPTSVALKTGSALGVHVQGGGPLGHEWFIGG
jgi:hypothetical protein